MFIYTCILRNTNKQSCVLFFYWTCFDPAASQIDQIIPASGFSSDYSISWQTFATFYFRQRSPDWLSSSSSFVSAWLHGEFNSDWTSFMSNSLFPVLSIISFPVVFSRHIKALVDEINTGVHWEFVNNENKLLVLPHTHTKGRTLACQQKLFFFFPVSKWLVFDQSLCPSLQRKRRGWIHVLIPSKADSAVVPHRPGPGSRLQAPPGWLCGQLGVAGRWEASPQVLEDVERQTAHQRDGRHLPQERQRGDEVHIWHGHTGRRGGDWETHTHIHTHFPVINETRSCRTTVQFFTTISGTSVTNAATIDYFYSGLIKWWVFPRVD